MEQAAAKVITLLQDQAYEDIEEISALLKKILQLKPGPEKPHWSYALVGKHGEGKSTVTNCLLGRHNLAGVSKGTKSCTQFATEYRYKVDAADETDMSDVTIAFFDNATLEANMEENVMRYRRVHHQRDEEVDESDDESLEPALTREITKHDVNLSIEAHKVFRLIVKGDKQSEEELEEYLKTSDSFTDGTLVTFLLRKQRERLDALGVDVNNTVTYHNVPDKLVPGSEKGTMDITAVRKEAEALAPLVKLVTVVTGGMLLRYGLVLLDIPGYGDLNQARIASANAHRRGAHGEIIIGSAPRIEDSEDLDGQIHRSRKAHGDRNTILVMNQIDKAYDVPDYGALLNEIQENKDSPFAELHEALKAADNDDADGDYEVYIAETAQCAMVRQFAEPTEDALKQRHGGRISVFSVVASAAHEWLDEYRAEDPTWGPYMSGIPHLKRGLLSLTAEQKLQIYYEHYFRILPNLVDDVQRILKKTAAKTKVLSWTRRSLKQCFQKAIRSSRAAKESNSISVVQPIYEDYEKIAVTKRIKALIGVWGDSTVVRFQTFLHTLVCKGIPISYASVAYRDREGINWNRDLLETMERPTSSTHAYVSQEAHLSDWKIGMMSRSAEISNAITSPITDLWALVDDIIATSAVPPALKKRTLTAWRKVENEIRDMVNRFPSQLTAAINAIYTEVTTEEDIECMIAKMNDPAYGAAAFQRRGRRVYERQRQSLVKSLCTPNFDGKSFVDRFEDNAMQKMNARIAQVSETFIAAVDAKLKAFIRITKQFVETDVYNTAPHVAARKILQNWLPEFQQLLLNCQRQFPDQEYQQEVQLMGSLKHMRPSEEEESPMKKVKVENEDEIETAQSREDRYCTNQM
ncbi:hypothetical protein P171DRAFT_490786 [Karstenula rhodostoma CBS 690.94]|uniref:Uncharacterized protein n=1 Tax=Karstenula rhodostoma CBS 690.94 TaxID=1392251 RepID=A0A9P4P7B7_9PLEO|nr:hypothetical protein P171DRAFT_490786 [Karstenula rhodostoma CBS 690.94]